MKRLNILLSAYACEPNRGSEPGVGWNAACTIARHHDVWVLTRAVNREPIEAALAKRPVPGLHFAYHDPWTLPAGWDYDAGKLTAEVHYYMWQVTAYHAARRLHREVGFDLAHHVTYIRYWMPSLMAWLPVPFVLGPVGGAETAPDVFWKDAGERAQRFERVRDVARWLGEHDPLVRLGIRRSAVALATTEQTAARLRHLGAARVERMGACGVQRAEIEALGQTPAPPERPVRFLVLGRLLHWKGYHLALRAFARASLPDAAFWIVGDGPWREPLEAEAEALEVADRVTFWGRLPHAEALDKLAQSHVFVHPSLHDSDGTACIEGMAARRPVLCLDTGGPAYQVTPETGIRVPLGDPAAVVGSLAEAMRTLASDADLRARLGEAGHRRALDLFAWDAKTEELMEIYASVVGPEVRRGEEAAYAD